MTSFYNFALDSYKKRREFRFLFATQALITLITYYLVIISGALLNSLFQSASILNASISNYYAAFFIVMAIMSIVFSLGIVLFIIRLTYYYQAKEIAIMVSVGGLLEKIQNFFLVQLILMTLLANLTGLGIAYLGVFISISLINIFFPNFLALSLIIPDFQVILVFIIIFFGSYMISARLIMNSTKRYPDSLISDEIDFTSARENSFLARVFVIQRAKTGITDIVTKIVRLNIMRKSFVFILSLITTLLFIFLLVSLVFGSFLISDSINTSMYHGTGGDKTYMIVDQSQSNFFSKTFSLYSENEFIEDFRYSDSVFDFLPILDIINNNRPADLVIDDRIILNKDITGSTPPSREEGSTDINLGSIKISNGYLVGLNNQIPKWNYYGKSPSDLSTDFISTELIAGEQLAWNLFTNPFNGILHFNDRTSNLYTISSVIVDPFMKGNAIYMPLDNVIDLYGLNPNQRNLLLLNSANSDFIEGLEPEIQMINQNLDLISISTSIQENNQFGFLFNVMLFTSIIPLIGAYILVVYAYSQQLIDERKRQMNIFKVYGMSKEKFKKVLLKEIQGFTQWGYVIGILIGFVFTYEFIVPFPVLTIQNIFLTLIILVSPWIVLTTYLSKKMDTIYDEYCVE